MRREGTTLTVVKMHLFPLNCLNIGRILAIEVAEEIRKSVVSVSAAVLMHHTTGPSPGTQVLGGSDIAQISCFYLMQLL